MTTCGDSGRRLPLDFRFVFCFLGSTLVCLLLGRPLPLGGPTSAACCEGSSLPPVGAWPAAPRGVSPPLVPARWWSEAGRHLMGQPRSVRRIEY
jgi:hypothetical protein